MNFDELRETLEDKVYAVEITLDEKKLSKIGYTTHKEMKTRIASFKPVGELKKKLNKDSYRVKVCKSPHAQSLERIAKVIAIKRGYPKTNNRNLGNGWTEYFGTPDFPVSQSMIWSCIMTAKNFLLKELEKNEE